MLDEWIRGSKGDNGDKAEIIPFMQGKKSRYLLIIVICLGLLALIWPFANSPSTAPAPPVVLENNKDEGSPQARMTAELESILSRIEGCGRVKVSISLSSGGEKTYASNLRTEKREIEETDSQRNNKKSNEESIQRDLAVSSGAPLLIEDKSPEVVGVLVVAEGANKAAIREQLTDATATLLNISPHKVRVMPGKGDK